MIVVGCGRFALTGGFSPGRSGEWRWGVGMRGSKDIGFQNWYRTQPDEDNEGKPVFLMLDLDDYTWMDHPLKRVKSTKRCYVCELN